MLRIIIFTLAFLITAAQAEEKTYSLQLTQNELGVIGSALSAAPYRDVAALIAKIQKQITEQQKSEKEQSSPPTGQ